MKSWSADELPVLAFSAIFARSSAIVISLSPLSRVVRGNAVCQSIDSDQLRERAAVVGVRLAQVGRVAGAVLEHELDRLPVRD